MTYKCTNCTWEGEVLSTKPLEGFCPICGDKVTGTTIKKETEKLEPELQDRVEDFVDDLKDDGKRNYSNRKSKKKGVKK